MGMSTREQIERHLASRKSEFEAGQKVMLELEARQASLRETLLHTSGAIQVLQEQLSIADGSDTGTSCSVNSVRESDVDYRESQCADRAATG